MNRKLISEVIHLESLEKVRKINANYPNNEYITKWKAEGKQVVGWICNYVPEELIHAAGMLPVRVTGYREQHSLNVATIRLSATECSYTRSMLQMMLDQKLDFMNGFVCGNCCDGTRRFSEVCLLEGFKDLKIGLIDPPFKLTDSAIGLYKQELAKAREWLENSFGVKITDEALRQSIEVFNKTRALLRQVMELRKPNSPRLSGSEFMEVVNAGFMIPKEEFNKILEQLITDLEISDRSLPSGHRLMISGTPITNPEFFRMVEELGGVIVAEEMCTGARYYWDLVDDDTQLDPLEALASRYLRNFPCARMTPATNRMEDIRKLAEEMRVDGVISAIVRFCAFYISDVPELREVLGEKEIGMLELNVEYNQGINEQNKTRIQAFLENLK